jgi:hypothetical protein
MLKPDRHTNPDFSVINISAFMLRQLKAQYSVSYDQLLEKVIKGMGEKAKENYPYALNFLYLMGKLNYKEATDTFTYNEAK